MRARRLWLALAAGLLLGTLVAPAARAGGSQTRTCEGSAQRCSASFSLAGGASNERLVVRLPDTDLRLASVVATPRAARGAYDLSRGRFRLGGSEYVATLSAVESLGRRARLTLTFRRRASAAPRCRVRNLTARIGRVRPGAGQRTATLVLRNRSRRACSTFGYVGLRLLDRSGDPLATDVVRDHAQRVVRVRLQPGDRAFASIRWGAIAGRGEPVDRPCEPDPARVAITPPNAYRHLVARWRAGPVCEHGRIRVRPLRDRP